MRRSVKLGRIAGIEIGVNWTWFVVFGLVAWTLAVAVFPSQNHGLSRSAYWAMGIVAALLFFASILLHELGHALQARRDDVRIEGITLWLFGGVARFRDMYRTPGAEFRIAVAGPLVTVAIAGALIAVGALVNLPVSVDGVVVWLAYINFTVLAFNLLPALPLDGGRLLHAALWRFKHSLLWATRVGTAVGVGFGYLMIGGGLALFFLDRSGFGGLWLAVIGWFLITAARAEAAQVQAREALRGTHVADLMSDRPVTVPPDLTLDHFVDDVARWSRHSTYPVVQDEHPLGLMTSRCVSQVPRDEWEVRQVRDCMVPRERVPALRPDEDAAEALGELRASQAQRGIVVEDDHVVGLLSISDLMRAVDGDGALAGGGRRPW